MNIFNHFEWDRELHDVVVYGVGLVREVLRPTVLNKLREEVESGPFEPAEEGTKLVKQKFDRYAFMNQPPANMKCLRYVQGKTQEMIHRHSHIYPTLQNWSISDIVVQRYDSDGYLTAHRDLARHPYIIASYTVSGSCMFDVLESRSGPVRVSLELIPGDLLLLMAPGLVENPSIDERPFHQLTGSLEDDEPRIAVTFRHNTAPDKPITGFGYLNS